MCAERVYDQHMGRLSVNINDETALALHDIAARRGISITEVVRRATAVLKYVEDEVTVGGKTLRVVDEDTGDSTVVRIL